MRRRVEGVAAPLTSPFHLRFVLPPGQRILPLYTRLLDQNGRMQSFSFRSPSVTIGELSQQVEMMLDLPPISPTALPGGSRLQLLFDGRVLSETFAPISDVFSTQQTNIIFIRHLPAAEPQEPPSSAASVSSSTEVDDEGSPSTGLARLAEMGFSAEDIDGFRGVLRQSVQMAGEEVEESRMRAIEDAFLRNHAPPEAHAVDVDTVASGTVHRPAPVQRPPPDGRPHSRSQTGSVPPSEPEVAYRHRRRGFQAASSGYSWWTGRPTTPTPPVVSWVRAMFQRPSARRRGARGEGATLLPERAAADAAEEVVEVPRAIPRGGLESLFVGCVVGLLVGPPAFLAWTNQLIGGRMLYQGLILGAAANLLWACTFAPSSSQVASNTYI
eukprot:TRINITY_DN71016_c0_g1_i1.p1 TRINITY_DN71016_c0_g1~~TRINITY_DN71016_c0_g1_i1.p1  ORF type:complete len:384 (-),score=38.30 TRINITY_DN71016_c0_g1_i1:563-1714(-)